MVTLIAEIGNNHFGRMDLAKRLILESRDAGADLIKLQAIPRTHHGSMPMAFYAEVSLDLSQYLELFYFAKEQGIDAFFSIWDEARFGSLREKERYHKIAASQCHERLHEIENTLENSFVSFKKEFMFYASFLPPSCVPLLATEYLTMDPCLYFLDYLNALSRGRFGYSDHTIGIQACEIAAKQYGVEVIEKHVTLEKNKEFFGIIFRDTVHAADVKEIRELKRRIG